MGKLVIGIILFLMGQALIWVQTNGQFVWTWAKENPFWMAAIFSMPISYMFIYATTYVVGYFDGSLWPGWLGGHQSQHSAYIYEYDHIENE